MNIVKIEELKAIYDSRKSFYKKAHIKYTDEGDIILQSYYTDVAILKKDGSFNFTKYSNTTNRHIKEFMRQFNIDIKEFYKK